MSINQQDSNKAAVNNNNNNNLTHHRHISNSSLSSIASTVTLSSTSTVQQIEPQPNQYYSMMIRDDNEKLSKRLSLLRDEYVKLQTKYHELQSKYDRLASTSMSNVDSDTSNDLFDSNGTRNSNETNRKSSSVTFVNNILNFIGSLYDNESYSDLSAKLMDGNLIRLHKFVLRFRSNHWDQYGNLDNVDLIDLEQLSSTVGIPLFRWIYTGIIELNSKEEEFILEIVRYASRFNLKPLIEQCEEALIGFVRVDNCIYFNQTSEEHGLNRLAEYSAKLVTLYWDSLQASDFDKVSTEYLYRLFKEKSQYPLHKAIRIMNEDLIFLLLVDFNAQLVTKVNELDNLGTLPLDLALRSGSLRIAKTLLENHANANSIDNDGWPLLLRYLLDDRYEVVQFLIENGSNVFAVNTDGDCALHLAADKTVAVAEQLASFANDNNNNDDNETIINDDQPNSHQEPTILDIVKLLIDSKLDTNIQNRFGDTALHRSIRMRNKPVFDCLLQQSSINIEVSNSHNETPFTLALDLLQHQHDNRYYAEQLLTKGVQLDRVVEPTNGDTLLHCAIRCHNEAAALFLVQAGSNVNSINLNGESILHLAAYSGFLNLVQILLQRNANCNMLTTKPIDIECQSSNEIMDENESEIDSNDPFAEPKSVENRSTGMIYNQTALHLAILGRHETIIKEIINYHDRASRMGHLNSALMTPNFDMKNSAHQTPLSLAIKLRLKDVAEMLILSGSDVDVRDERKNTLLHQAIMDGDEEMAHFLLQHGADTNIRTEGGETYLQYAVRYRLPTIVEELCTMGADVNVRSSINDDPVLWEALKLISSKDDHQCNDETIASILVRYNCDTDCHHRAGDGFDQTLLHRALDENNEPIAVFLIRAGCDIHCCRVPGPNGEGSDDCDRQTPLHMACSWGMAMVVETLLEHSVDPNMVDNEGKTPLMIAILNQHHTIIRMLIDYRLTDLYRSDNYGNTPFSLAIKLKSRSTAQSLVARDGLVGEQCDGMGRNFLHLALQRSDYDSVLFLLDNKIDISARVQDSIKKAPIHLAAETGSEIILRTLVLAGADVNDVTMQNQTALHLAAEHDNYLKIEILLDLNIRIDVRDSNGNTALHIACLRGHYESSRILLERKVYDLSIGNLRGQTALHCLANSTDKINAAAIFDHLVTIYSDLDLNVRDSDRNTALLVAYMNGNGRLCRSLVREGASLGMRNVNGISIFNHQMPTRQLLTSLLDSLTRSPEWNDGPECLECGIKFGMTNRRHHCRHCGRELCAKCSTKEMIIMKFQVETKKSVPSRVCELCYDVLTIGTFN